MINNKGFLLNILIVLSFFMACTKSNSLENQPSEGDFDKMIIGIYFGECIGDCATYFLLEDGKIYRDAVKNAFERNLSFSDNPISLTDELLQRFTDLETLLPLFILESEEASFGCPDCGDWGAIHFSVDDKSWTLDNSVDNNPKEIRAFVIEIQGLLMDLNNF